MAAKDSDPLSVNARLYAQIARLLDDMEAADRDDKMTMPQRINALIAVGRIQIMFSALRKAMNNDPINAGEAVRKYAAAFDKPKPNAARGRKTHPRLAAYQRELENDASAESTGFDPEGDGGGGGEAA
jgi:hypothetical protein